MNVSRRGFLGILSAFGAAVAAGRVVSSSEAAVRPIPREQADLMRILKDCRVQTYGMAHSMAGPSRLEVQYVYAPNAPRTSLDDFVDAHRKNMLPVSVSITTQCDSFIDICTFGGPREVGVERSQHMVDVVFI